MVILLSIHSIHVNPAVTCVIVFPLATQTASRLIVVDVPSYRLRLTSYHSNVNPEKKLDSLLEPYKRVDCLHFLSQKSRKNRKVL